MILMREIYFLFYFVRGIITYTNICFVYMFSHTWQSKIVRVLNLWQKNGVFKIEIIQPLLDMAAGTSNAAPVAENVTNNEGMYGQVCLWA